MIAERFHDDKERSWAMGFAMGGMALGILGELIKNIVYLIIAFNSHYGFVC